MAKARVVTRVCDACDSADDLAEMILVVSRKGRRRQRKFDACGGCRKAQPIEEWMNLIPASMSGGRSIGARRVVTQAHVDEIARSV